MSDSVENARKFLESLQRFDLSTLLSLAEVESTSIEDRHWYEHVVIVRAPRPFAEALKQLPGYDRKRISEAVVSDEADTTAPSDISVTAMDGAPVEGFPALLPELIIHREMMIDVSTGGTPIQQVNDYYRSRQVRVRAVCESAGIEYENEFEDLWDWYRYWKEHLGGYADRRHYVGKLFAKPIQAASVRSQKAVEEREPTGWERVDRAMAKAHNQLQIASVEEDFQAIGLMCREVIISLAQAVYVPDVHQSVDGVTPSKTDANRMLEAYVHHEFPGDSYKEVRAHARASLALSLNLQHRRTATRQLAELCVEATASTTAVISIISNRRS